jgi:hypothetical protein
VRRSSSVTTESNVSRRPPSIGSTERQRKTPAFASPDVVAGARTITDDPIARLGFSPSTLPTMIIRHARRTGRFFGGALSPIPSRAFAIPLPSIGVPSQPPPSPKGPQTQPGGPAMGTTSALGAAVPSEEKRVERMTPEAPWRSSPTSSDPLEELLLSCLHDHPAPGDSLPSLSDLHRQMGERARTQLAYDLAYEPTPDQDRRVSLESPRPTWQEVARIAARRRAGESSGMEAEDDGIVLVAHVAEFDDGAPARTAWCTGFGVSGKDHELVATCAHTLQAVRICLILTFDPEAEAERSFRLELRPPLALAGLFSSLVQGLFIQLRVSLHLCPRATLSSSRWDARCWAVNAQARLDSCEFGHSPSIRTLQGRVQLNRLISLLPFPERARG